MSPKVSSISKTDNVSMGEDINASDGYTSVETEESMIEEVTAHLEQELQITDLSKHLLVNDLDSDQNEMHNTNNDDTRHNSQTNEVNDLNINIKKLENLVTFPHSKERASSLSDKEMENESVILKQSQCHIEDTESASAKAFGNKSILKQSQCLLENTNLASANADGTTYERSFSLPSRLKLVSAMKGGRQKLGNPSKGKLSVKWAPDVYDPPITLMSHTVKNHHHQQRSKTKKKDRNRNKHKGKSSRGSPGDRKHVYRTTSSSITQPSFQRLQAPMDKLLLDGFDQSGVEILDYPVSGAESKCGNNFIAGSLAKVRYRTAEAL